MYVELLGVYKIFVLILKFCVEGRARNNKLGLFSVLNRCFSEHVIVRLSLALRTT